MQHIRTACRTIAAHRFTVFVSIFLVGLFLRLPVLDQPHEVVFDEFHFGKFINHYCCDHKHFFDVHPPHGKLFIAALVRGIPSAQSTSYNGDQPFAAIGETLRPLTPLFTMRLAPALWGALVAPLFFLLLRALGLAMPAAFVGAACLLFDTGIWVQSRFMLLDASLLCGLIGSLLFYQYSYQASTLKQHRRANLQIMMAGAFAGLAVGTKFTGLTALGVVGIFLCWDGFTDWRKKRLHPSTVYKLPVFLATFAAVYLLGWLIHFQWLSQPGPGDLFYRPTGAFFQDLISIHRSMLTANYGITTPHHDASKWWTWPIMQTPVYYWVSGNKVIYFVGNPVVWWGSILIFLISIAAWLTKAARTIPRNLIPPPNQASRKKRQAVAPSASKAASPLAAQNDATSNDHIDGSIPARSFALIGLALFISFAPYILIPRPLFLYHYLPPLIFIVSWSMLCLGRAGWLQHGTSVRTSFLAVLAILTGFVLVLPLTAGFSETLGSYKEFIFMVFPAWR